MLRPDVREIYLKRLLTLERYNHASFQQALNLMLLVLDDPNDPEPVTTALEAVDDFRARFANEQGIPPIEYILWELDKMRMTGREILRVKSKYRRKKFSYQEILLWLNDLEDGILELVRKKAQNIRITNPEISLV